MPRKTRHDTSLPHCEGPKLHAFKHGAAVVDFKRLLSELDSTDTSAGGQAHVFEVSILSKTYALKVFKFYDDTEHRAPLDEDEQEVVPVDLLRAHMDPFYRECRAYGRLIEKQMNGKVAARCHGYLTISAGKEEELRQNFRVDIWDRPDSEYLKPVSRREPFRAIVKDLISEEIAFTQKMVGKMRRDLKKIRSVGVYPMDIHARNYKQGLLLDFSLAMTEPHYLFAIMPRWRVEEFKLDDLLAFDSMIKDEGVVTWERALPNSEYCKKLRPRKSKN